MISSSLTCRFSAKMYKCSLGCSDITVGSYMCSKACFGPHPTMPLLLGVVGATGLTIYQRRKSNIACQHGIKLLLAASTKYNLY